MQRNWVLSGVLFSFCWFWVSFVLFLAKGKWSKASNFKSKLLREALGSPLPVFHEYSTGQLKKKNISHSHPPQNEISRFFLTNPPGPGLWVVSNGPQEAFRLLSSVFKHLDSFFSDWDCCLGPCEKEPSHSCSAVPALSREGWNILGIIFPSSGSTWVKVWNINKSSCIMVVILF